MESGLIKVFDSVILLSDKYGPESLRGQDGVAGFANDPSLDTTYAGPWFQWAQGVLEGAMKDSHEQAITDHSRNGSAQPSSTMAPSVDDASTDNVTPHAPSRVSTPAVPEDTTGSSTIVPGSSVKGPALATSAPSRIPVTNPQELHKAIDELSVTPRQQVLQLEAIMARIDALEAHKGNLEEITKGHTKDIKELKNQRGPPSVALENSTMDKFDGSLLRKRPNPEVIDTDDERPAIRRRRVQHKST